MYDLWGGFLIGLLGSLHCVGMCGPIALSLNYPEKRLSEISGMLLYNFGRIVTYSLFGLIAGMVGRGIFYSGVQQHFSIGVGVLLVVVFLVPLRIRTQILEKYNFLSFIYKKLSGIVTKAGLWNKFTIGILNGFLPCGLVFLAVANALVQTEMYYSVIYMFLFGLGTIPLMLLLLMTKSAIKSKFRFSFNKILPLIGILIGVLMILRGLELNIPYLSPKIEHKIPGEVQENCD